jgi:hypothetical protein
MTSALPMRSSNITPACLCRSSSSCANTPAPTASGPGEPWLMLLLLLPPAAAADCCSSEMLLLSCPKPA